MKRLLPKSLSGSLSLVIVELALFFLFWKLIPGGGFATWTTIEQLSRHSAIVMMTSIGMTFVIISAGIDLSVGSVVAFSCIVAAVILKAHGNWIEALFLATLSGAVWGMINGLVITKLKVGPFIVTLGTYLIVRACALGLAHEQSVYSPPSGLDMLMKSVLNFGPPFFAPGVWMTLIATVVFVIVLAKTRFGRRTIAIGSNENAARLCGIPVERVQLLVYTLCGLLAGLAGVLSYSQLTYGDPQVADGLELSAIAAVVIGGASLLGGEGTVFGAIIGALIMQTISDGTTQMGLPHWVQKLVTGCIIVIAVGLDRWRARRAETKSA